MNTSDIVEELVDMVRERDWSQFHSPENLAKSIVIEAGELLECFQWTPDAVPEDVEDELADVFTYALLLARRLDLDPITIVRSKLAKTKIKYPIEKAQGESKKYDKL